LKNAHIGLFVIGIITGGVMMSILFGFSLIPNSLPADQIMTLTPGPDHVPHLIALEPTSVQREATPVEAYPTMTTEPDPATGQMVVSSTPTSILLVNEQQSEIIGYSVEGRPLIVYKFGDGEQERMIVAGIHGGDEWNTVTLANQLISYLDQNPGVIPEDVTLYILPNLNPDGEARAHNKYGRLNHNGVDLNRNFPANWKMDWDRSGCWNSLPTSGGTGPGSEVETQTLMNFINDHNIQVLVSYHSAALGIFPGGLPWDEDSVRLAESLAEATSYPFPCARKGCQGK
jgi:hypothetical protein